MKAGHSCPAFLFNEISAAAFRAELRSAGQPRDAVLTQNPARRPYMSVRVSLR